MLHLGARSQGSSWLLTWISTWHPAHLGPAFPRHRGGEKPFPVGAETFGTTKDRIFRLFLGSRDPSGEATVCRQTQRGGPPTSGSGPAVTHFLALVVSQAPWEVGLGLATGVPSSFPATLRSAVVRAKLTRGLPGQPEGRAQVWGSADLAQLAALTPFSWLGVLRRVTSPLWASVAPPVNGYTSRVGICGALPRSHK